MADAKINLVATDSASKVIANVRGEMAQAKESVSGLVTALTGLGVIGGAGFLSGLVRNAVDAADNLRDLSQQTGISVEALGGLGFAASQSGGNLESIAAAAGKLNKSLAEAAAGSKTAMEPFKALGIAVVDSAGKTKAADVVFAEIADRFKDFEDGPEKAALALRLLGKAGADQISLLNDGGDALRENIEYYKRYSGVTQEVADASDNFNDTLGKVHLITGALGTTIAAQALPAMQALAEELLSAKEEGGAFNVVASAVRVSLETVAVVGANFAFVFKGVGREIGAVAAQLVALGSGNFSGFTAIGDAVKEDGVRARAELDALEKRIYGVVTAADAVAVIDSPSKKKRSAPRLPSESADSAASQQAKAQLALDLENIKKAFEAIQSEYANNENILQAMRGVGLVDDDAYYSAKRALVELTSEAEGKAYANQISRLRQESLAGKEKLENDKQIAELQGKLAAGSAKAATDLVILGIQEKGAVDARSASYLSARQAAQDYFDTLELGYARELASVGKGKQAREYDAGLAQVEDRFAQRRRDLENNRAQSELAGKFTPEAQQQYDRQLAILSEYQVKEKAAYAQQYTALHAAQGDWLNGANEALANYLDETRDVAGSVENLLTGAFKGAEDSLVDFVKTGKLSFSSLADSIISDLARIAIRQNVTGPLAASASSGAAAGAAWLSTLFSANGNAFDASGLVPFANGGVFDSPMAFSYGSGKMGVLGEAGPEAILPLSRGSDGKLGLAGGSGGVNVTINVIEDASKGGTQQKRSDGNGGDIMDVFVVQVKQSIAADISRGSGDIPSAMESKYGLNRSVGAF